MGNVINEMIEFVDVNAVDSQFFAIIRLSLDGTYYTLRFGVLEEDHARLKYILTYRPFESTSVGDYRYFFALSYQKNGQSGNVSIISVRIEQATQHKQFQLPMGNKCLSNLLWFSEIKDKKILEHFIVT